MTKPIKGSSITPKERERIIKLLKSGKSRHAVAKEVGRSKDSVSRIAKKAGLTADKTSTEAATSARVRYAEAERLELINKGFDKVDEILGSLVAQPDHAKALREVVTALGILIDKRRLEETPSVTVDMTPYLAVLGKAAADVWGGGDA